MIQAITRKPESEPPHKATTTASPTELPHGVHLGDLLTPEFISRHSRFSAEDDMFKASGFDIQSAEDFFAIPDDDWDRFIGGNTAFSTWVEMLEAARLEWFQKNMQAFLARG